jgi:ribosome-binding protein aMBF1 (putative translation factor)
MKQETDDAVRIIDDLTGDDPELRRTIERERLGVRIARLVYDARTKAGLTQKQLAMLVGTKQPDIARLEDSDYCGHSLSMLHRIALALNRDLDVRFTERRRRRS